MADKALAELTDQELLEESKKGQSNPQINALLIGFLVGIIIFSILKSSVGLFTLIPLYLIYKFSNNTEHNKAVEDELNKRNLS